MVLSEKRLVSEDPLGFIRKCVKGRRIYWTYHVNMRLRTRSIPRHSILDAVDSFEVIEKYPDDKYLPSYLVYAKYQDTVLHVQFATDVEGDNVRVVTAYYPDTGEWNEELKIRR